jgi:hypothetical protein
MRRKCPSWNILPDFDMSKMTIPNKVELLLIIGYFKHIYQDAPSKVVVPSKVLIQIITSEPLHVLISWLIVWSRIIMVSYSWLRNGYLIDSLMSMSDIVGPVLHISKRIVKGFFFTNTCFKLVNINEQKPISMFNYLFESNVLIFYFF